MPANPFPTISIVTPSLNQATFLPATIESVISQDYPGVDYQVMDGGSTDATPQILASYSQRFHWKSEPDDGQSAAINQGWRQAQGEIIAWLNSDDIYYPGSLYKVGTFFKDHPEVDILYGDCDYIDTLGQRLQPYPTQPYHYIKLLSDTVNFIPQPAVFIRRKVLEQVGYLDEALHYVMDFDYWLRAGLSQRFAYLPTCLAGLRIHAEAKSIAWLGKFANELVTIYNHIFSRPDLPREVQNNKLIALANIYYRAADCTFWANQIPEARAYALKSMRFAPFRIRRLWFYLLLGKPGRRWAERKHGNPYLVQTTPSGI